MTKKHKQLTFFILIVLVATNAFAETMRERLRRARESSPTKTRKKSTTSKRMNHRANPSGDIKFIKTTLYGGMDGHSDWGFNQKVFNKIQAKADEVNLDLTDILEEQCVYRQLDDKFFLLFYNKARAIGCPRNYLIQKVFLEKHRSNSEIRREYLVEVMKLNKDGYYKRADEHYKVYSLGSSQLRKTNVTLELGCGEIPHVAAGKEWPYEKNILYKRVQNYAPKPGLYDQINYDFSENFRFSFTFSKGQKPQVKVPGYKCQEF